MKKGIEKEAEAREMYRAAMEADGHDAEHMAIMHIPGGQGAAGKLLLDPPLDAGAAAAGTAVPLPQYVQGVDGVRGGGGSGRRIPGSVSGGAVLRGLRWATLN